MFHFNINGEINKIEFLEYKAYLVNYLQILQVSIDICTTHWLKTEWLLPRLLFIDENDVMTLLTTGITHAGFLNRSTSVEMTRFPFDELV